MAEPGVLIDRRRGILLDELIGCTNILGGVFKGSEVIALHWQRTPLQWGVMLVMEYQTPRGMRRMENFGSFRTPAEACASGLRGRVERILRTGAAQE